MFEKIRCLSDIQCISVRWAIALRSTGRRGRKDTISGTIVTNNLRYHGVGFVTTFDGLFFSGTLWLRIPVMLHYPLALPVAASNKTCSI